MTDRQTDRQADRQTDRRGAPYSYFYDKLTGTGKYQKPNGNVAGGADNKFRKLAGIGEYTRRSKGEQKGRSESTTGTNAGNVDERSNDSGEYP